ncbi:hypothetical protein AGMMS49587_05790 [Spirochaetia bacterium]|nr:hypothetical protein AGMMS49587_05790 [Spirochaetia bacterium]
MKQFVLLGVVVLLVMLMGSLMLTDNLFLGSMAFSEDSESTVEKAAIKEDVTEAESEDTKRFARYSGYIDRLRGTSETEGKTTRN